MLERKRSPQESAALNFANYIIETEFTIRKTAEYFMVGKTTVWYYIHKYLPTSYPKTYEQVTQIFKKHKHQTN